MGRVPDTTGKDPVDAGGASSSTLIQGVVGLSAAGLACLGVRHLVQVRGAVQRRADVLAGKVDSLTADLRTRLTDLQASQTTCKQLQQEVKTARQLSKDLQSQLTAASSEAKKAQQEVVDLEQGLADAQQGRADCARRVIGLESDLAASQQNLAAVQTEMTRLASSLEQEKAAKTAAAELNSELHEETNGLRRSLNASEAARSAATGKLHALKEQVSVQKALGFCCLTGLCRSRVKTSLLVTARSNVA